MRPNPRWNRSLEQSKFCRRTFARVLPSEPRQDVLVMGSCGSARPSGRRRTFARCFARGTRPLLRLLELTQEIQGSDNPERPSDRTAYSSQCSRRRVALDDLVRAKPSPCSLNAVVPSSTPDTTSGSITDCSPRIILTARNASSPPGPRLRQAIRSAAREDSLSDRLGMRSAHAL